MASFYTGQTYRGVDYSPTWPGWVVGANATQTGDSDFANDAFASLWASSFRAAPAGSPSAPINNGSNYRDDLKTIANDGFNLVRLYNWDMARGTTSTSDVGLDHLNFLNYAESLGLKVVVPVSDFFLNDTQFSWNHVTPSVNYSFSSAPAAIQKDFTQFIASITDPATGKIHSAVHSIAVGNEGDIGEGLQGPPGTDASDFLARTNWWIYNLHQQLNGTSATGPDGLPVVNGANGTIVPLTATFANADQGTGISSWFKALVMGVQAGQSIPNTWYDGDTTFSARVNGLSAADPSFASYYYNSFNIGQSTTTPPFGNGIANTLALYDSGASPWPGAQFNVPLLLMEVFTPNRSQYNPASNQAVAAANESKDIEAYLAAHHAGTAASTTNLMGYNYFEFNDEPAANKFVGLYQYGGTSQNAQTGTTGVFYGTFPNATFPVYTLTPTAGPNGQGTLVAAWTANFPHGAASIEALSATRAEGDGTGTPFTFAVSRSANVSEAATVGFAVTGSGANPADGADFVGGIFPSGLISFAAGEISKLLTIYVTGDALAELANSFTVTLVNPSEGLNLVTESAAGVILDEDLKGYDDAYVILQGRALTAAAAAVGVLANDETVPPEAVAQLSGVAHGSLQLATDGGIAYAPSAGFTGIDTFTYYALGENGASDSARASIHVVPVTVGATTTLNLLALTAQEKVASTYAAFFGRAADDAGFDYWLGEHARILPTQGPTAALGAIAGAFGASAEAKALYPFLANPVGATDSQIGAFVDSVYNNLFNRSSDTAGLAYWTGQIKQTVQAGQSVGSVLTNIMGGAQETAAAKDITTLMSKVAVSLAYVHQQDLHGTVWAGASDTAAATALLDAVTADPLSVLIGLRNAAELIAGHA